VNRSVQLILDASALRAYPSVHLGEPIAEVNEEGAGFGVPLVALVAASASAEVDALDLLTKHDGFVPLNLTMRHWRQVGATLGVVRDIAAARAVVMALELDCEVLTTQPELYAGLGDDPPIIAF
jgi:hypothetical protein